MQAGMRSRRDGRKDTVRSWAEASVWNMVCAMDLGLISEPCRLSDSTTAHFDDGSLVKTSTPMPNEFPAINSTIESTETGRSALGFPAKISSRSGKKPLPRRALNGKRRRKRRKLASTTTTMTTTTAPSKSTTAESNVCLELDRESDSARDTPLEKCWKSCKRKANGAPTKLPDRNYHDLDRSLGSAAEHLSPTSDRPRSVDLVPGICDQARRPGDNDDAVVPSTSDSRQTPDRAVDRQLRRTNAAKFVARRTGRRRRGRRKTKLKVPDTEDVNFETAFASTVNDESAVSSRTDTEESRKDDAWECEDETVISLQLEDGLQTCATYSQDLEVSPTSLESVIDAFEADFCSSRSFLDQERDSELEPTGLLEDIDAVPLAERIPTGGDKCPTVDDEEKRFENHRKYVRTSGRSGSNDSVGPVLSDARPTNDPADDARRSDDRKPRQRRKSCRDNDSRCKSTDSGVAQPLKRNKTAGDNGVVAPPLKDPALKTDTPRAKISRNDEEYHNIRRVTRGSTRISKENFVGKLIWGCCSGWWPALIIDADHVGMLSEAGKLWVYWIGEARISLLNEKTQIESFSCNMKHRLVQTSNVARVRAIDATMQMLRVYLGCTLTKPYWRWIENQFADLIERIDEIKFYPYPPKIEQRLAHLKERNAKATERYLLDQKRESQPKKIVEKPKEPPQQSDADLTRLPLREQNPGVITWAKIAGHNWWPAMIIDYRDCCMREPSFGCQWIMWYGDYKLSEIHHQSFLRFDMGLEKMRDYIDNTKKHNFLVGVLQASKDYYSRMGYETDNWTMAEMLKYFSKMDRSRAQSSPSKTESVKIYDKYSARIVKMLNELKNDPNVDDKRADDIQNSDDLRAVTSEQASLESLCLKCLKITGGSMEPHPFFEGSLCIQCSEQYKPCMFVFGNDGKCFYCTICAATGTVIICDNQDCPRVYCTACMKHLLCQATYEQVLLEDPWECFLCKARSGSVPDTVVRPRSNWKDKIIDMFRTSCSSSRTVADKHTGKTRKIRVLSLFDGLSTGLLVLRKLGLEVEVYYASEIDPNALMVSATHFGDDVIQLGDVRDITKERIKQMVPIDLLIGGSPCNDLSLANPARLGLHDPRGTGVLFFEYCRILKVLKRLNNGRHLFWLYENVASMPSKYRLEMNKYAFALSALNMGETNCYARQSFIQGSALHLGQEPDVIDSADFSPQHRLRLYWHNLPFDRYSLPFQGDADVQAVLTPHCQRYALVKKIRTVTTKVNSLKQGKAALKPILMKDESDSLWITELEEIFGFPRHYTDVKNLSATKRQKLIGKSWSVQTLTAMFKSLCSYFECNTAGPNSIRGF